MSSGRLTYGDNVPKLTPQRRLLQDHNVVAIEMALDSATEAAKTPINNYDLQIGLGVTWTTLIHMTR